MKPPRRKRRRGGWMLLDVLLAIVVASAGLAALAAAHHQRAARADEIDRRRADAAAVRAWATLLAAGADPDAPAPAWLASPIAPRQLARENLSSAPSGWRHVLVGVRLPDGSLSPDPARRAAVLVRP